MIICVYLARSANLPEANLPEGLYILPMFFLYLARSEKFPEGLYIF